MTEERYLDQVAEEIDEYMKTTSIGDTKRRIEITRLKKVINKLDMRKTRLEKRLFDLQQKEDHQ